MEPSENLARSYLNKTTNSLRMMSKAPSEDWKIVAAYYACYDALYALLQRAGFKSDIQDCTIALMKFFEFSKEDIEFIKKLKEKRINAQYYTTEEVKLKEENKVKDFVLKCKKMLNVLDFKKIREKIISRLNK